MESTVPIAISVAAGVIVGAVFVILGMFALRLCERGRWRIGLILLLTVLAYGGAVVWHSV